jgi:two-component system, response regulator YesN
VVHAKEFVMKSMTVGRYVPGVLVVDDEPLVRSFLRDALAARARVLEAEDGEQAIEILRGPVRDIDLILVDYVLPKASGLEVLQVTKRNWPWLPVVLLSGVRSEELAVKALRGGASDYLRKPIQLQLLLKVVAALTPRSPSDRGASETTSDEIAHLPVVRPEVHKGLAFMRDHFTETITLRDVAREAGLSRFYFCRLFHHETGVLFHDYLHELRVTRAKALLADRYLRVTEVAYAVGFNDLSHFDRTFRRKVGCSPSEYRQLLQSGLRRSQAHHVQELPDFQGVHLT